jgi:hypothetical protein
MKRNNEQAEVGEGAADGGAGSAVVEAAAPVDNGADAATGADTAAGADSTTDATGAKPVEPATSAPRRIDAPESEPADLRDSGDDSVAKKLVAVGGGALALVVLLISKRRGRRSRRLAAAVPALPNLATAQKLGRGAAKRARKAARRR